MTGRRLGAALSVLLGLGSAGCSTTVGVYHDIEGGAIAQARQAPPGASQPYPNLANVPPAPGPSKLTQAAIARRVQNTAPDVSPPSPGALAGLQLPSSPPPLPSIAGLNLPATPSTPAVPRVIAVNAPPRPNSAPVALAFQPGSAILPAGDAIALQGLALARGNATMLVGGFGDNISLSLAIARAQRLASALTASGVPPHAIRLAAARAGSGGFVQLLY